ncbi:MAG: hypothetical protein H6737_17070 [Alphaproteobacteria bacterium]|nr:hypothetical protein [Alphaproteobacteria bacterium]
MRWTHWIRQFHRWMSVAFTLAVIANFAAVGLAIEAVWIGLMALLPLFALLFSGLYLFVLPYTARWSRAS